MGVEECPQVLRPVECIHNFPVARKIEVVPTPVFNYLRYSDYGKDNSECIVFVGVCKRITGVEAKVIKLPRTVFLRYF